MGFRYCCQQCHSYQLCQDCFWRGHANRSHSNQHQMKEHSSWVGTPGQRLTNHSALSVTDKLLGCVYWNSSVIITQLKFNYDYTGHLISYLQYMSSNACLTTCHKPAYLKYPVTGQSICYVCIKGWSKGHVFRCALQSALSGPGLMHVYLWTLEGSGVYGSRTVMLWSPFVYTLWYSLF